MKKAYSVVGRRIESLILFQTLINFGFAMFTNDDLVELVYPGRRKWMGRQKAEKSGVWYGVEKPTVPWQEVRRLIVCR